MQGSQTGLMHNEPEPNENRPLAARESEGDGPRSSFEYPDDNVIGEDGILANKKPKEKKKKKVTERRMQKLVDVCLVITSSSDEEGQAKISLVKKLCNDILRFKVENQFDRLEKMGPRTEGEQR